MTSAAPNTDVLTQRVDNGRTGATTLAGFNASSLQSSSWGPLGTLPVQGAIWAQPLFVQGITMNDGAVHDIVLVATAHNYVYAFDASPATNYKQMWVTYLGAPDTTGASASQYTDVAPDGTPTGLGIGILSTPVVDKARGWVDLSYREINSAVSQAQQHVTALSLASGAVVQDHVITNGLMISSGEDGGWLCSGQELCGHIDGVRQRASLLLANNIIYVAFSLQQEGYWLWPGNKNLLARGQLLAFDASTMDFLGSWTAVGGSNTRMAGGIWQASVGPAADANGDVYLATGNAMSYVAAPYVFPPQPPPPQTATSTNTNPDVEQIAANNPHPDDYIPAAGSYGNAVVHLHATRNVTGPGVTIAPASSTSFFTPYRTYWHNIEDIDLGAAGPVLIPGTNQLIHGGKESVLYVLDRDNMGGFGGTDKYMSRSEYLGWASSQAAPSGSVTTCYDYWFQGLNTPRFVPTTPPVDFGAQQALTVGHNYDIARPLANCWGDFPHIHGTPTFGQFSPSQAYVYVWPEKDFLKAIPWTGSAAQPLGQTAATNKSVTPLPNGMPGAMLALSVDPSAQSGVLFASSPLDVGQGPLPHGTLRAFNPIPNANGEIQQIWTDFQTSPYIFAKFVPPTIAGNQVFQATWSNKVVVYGPGSAQATPMYTTDGAGVGMAPQDANQAQTVAGFIGNDGALHVIWKGDKLDWGPARNAQVTATSLATPGAPVTIVSSGDAVHAVFAETSGAIHWVSRQVPSTWVDHGAIAPARIAGSSRLGALVNGSTLDVFVAESDATMHVLSGSAAPFADAPIPGAGTYVAGASIATATNGATELDVFAVDTSGSLRRMTTQSGKGWSGSTVLATGFLSGGALAAATYAVGTTAASTSTFGVFGVDALDTVRGFTSTDGGRTFTTTAFTIPGYAPKGGSVAVGTYSDPSGNNHASLCLVGHAGVLDAFVLETLPTSPTAPQPGSGFPVYTSTPAKFAHTASFGIATPGASVAAWGSDVIVSGHNGLFAMSLAQWNSGNVRNRPLWFPTILTLAPPAPATQIAPQLETVSAPGGILPLQQWVSADFNGDGLADVANMWSTVEGGSIGIDVYLNQGNGTFVPQHWGTTTGAYLATEKWVVGDYNHDGRPDLANIWCTVEGGAIAVDVYLNAGTHFDFEPQWGKIGQTEAFYASSKWESGDFNHDGITDLADVWSTVEDGQIGIDVYVSNGASGFTFQPQWGRIETQGIFTASQSWFSGDFDQDGWPDLADVWDDVDTNGVPQIVIDVHLNSKYGSFTGSPSWGAFQTQGVFDPNDRWVTADFNGDGYPDLANAFSDDNSGFVSIDVHLNTKANAFTDQRWATLVGAYNGSAKVLSNARVPCVGFDIQQAWFAGSFHAGLTDFAYSYDNGGLVGIGEFASTSPPPPPRFHVPPNRVGVSVP